MTEFKRVFLDTAPIIYYLQRDEMYFEKMKTIFIELRKKKVELVSSDVTIAEYCVFPYRTGNQKLVEDFDNFIQIAGVEIIHSSEIIAKKSASIRAQYPAFKTMDSLQLAFAVCSGCDLFLTNDKQLRQYAEIQCLLIDDLFLRLSESGFQF